MVLAEYLSRMQDTTANAFLRSMLARKDSLAEEAYRLLPAEPVRDTAIISDLHRRALAYLVGRDTFLDDEGKPIAEPWVHDERPDLRILIADSLLPAVLDAARPHFMTLSMDSVRARVPTDGLQMAWYLGQVRRIGSRYYLDLTLRPVGGPCLCGGGVNLTLERRGGDWVVVDLSRWIS